MYSANFDYYRPQTLDEAVRLLMDHRGAKVLAGGHSLLPAMKIRLAAPLVLVDIARIPDLSGIEVVNGNLRIGAYTTHASVAASPVVRSACPILAETAGQIGDQQVRNRGTIGGSIVYGDPAADLPTVVKALRGSVTAVGPNGSREIAAETCFIDLLTTAIEPDEILTTVTVPVMASGMGGVYLKHRHPASHYAVVGVAAVVTLKEGTCDDVSLVIGGVNTTPVRCQETESALGDQAPSEQAIKDAVSKVSASFDEPMSDVYASGEYRLHLATVMARQALTEAVRRAA